MDGDGLVDPVAGGAWYRNSGDPRKPFQRIVFDAELNSVHDLVVGDLTGNGLPDIVAKPWRASAGNALGGSRFVVFLEDVP